jgi:hypothetical protein
MLRLLLRLHARDFNLGVLSFFHLFLPSISFLPHWPTRFIAADLDFQISPPFSLFHYSFASSASTQRLPQTLQIHIPLHLHLIISVEAAVQLSLPVKI